MSEENVEIAKRIYAAWNKGGPAAASIYYGPEIEWQEAAEVPDADVVRGRKAVLAYLDEWIGLFGSTRVEVQELIPVDPEHLISVFRYQVQGSASGIAGGSRAQGLFLPGAVAHCATACAKNALLPGARYCVGDVAGERGPCLSRLRRV